MSFSSTCPRKCRASLRDSLDVSRGSLSQITDTEAHTRDCTCLIHYKTWELRRFIRKPGFLLTRRNFLRILLPVALAVSGFAERLQVHLQIEVRLGRAERIHVRPKCWATLISVLSAYIIAVGHLINAASKSQSESKNRYVSEP